MATREIPSKETRTINEEAGAMFYHFNEAGDLILSLELSGAGSDRLAKTILANDVDNPISLGSFLRSFGVETADDLAARAAPIVQPAR
jgi:hypothetical protein